MTEIFTAKTVDEAKAMAVRKFRKRADEIRFEVIEEGRKGILGIGSKDARVKATYNPPAPKPEVNQVKKSEPVKPALEKPVEVAEKPVAAPVTAESPVEAAEPVADKLDVEPVETVLEAVTEQTETIAEPETEITAEAPVEEVAEVTEAPAEEIEPVTEAEEIAEQTEAVAEVEPVAEPETEPAEEKTTEVVESSPEEAEKSGEDESFSLDDFVLVEDETQLNEKVKIARDYITSIFRAMNIEVNFVIYQNETGAVIDIKSSNNGTVIGRRGETLDSLQYLCSIIANKGDKDYFRITIDCLGYRNKRKDTLKQLAKKVAKSVLKSGRSQTLEPMNPYERRVIHSTISEIEGVSSRSVGEEPYRKIIISSNTPRNGGKRRNGQRDDRRNSGRRNDRPRRPQPQREPIEVREMDLSTSFEKDYKKPKPEDSMDIGLYGKIEF